MIIAMWTELIRLFVLRQIFAKGFAAFLADERHLDRFAEHVIL